MLSAPRKNSKRQIPITPSTTATSTLSKSIKTPTRSISNKLHTTKTPITQRNKKASFVNKVNQMATKRATVDETPVVTADGPDLIEVSVTAHARTNNSWKKQKYNNKKNNGEDNDNVILTDQNQLVPVDLNQAKLTPDAGLDATTPLRTTPYTKQLSQKKKELWKTFTAMTKDIEKGYNSTNFQLKKSFEAGHMKNYIQYQFDQPLRSKHGIACVTGPVMPSPVDHAYRNKNEFTISYGLGEDNDIEIGFLCGRFADGESRVGSPEGSLTAPLAIIEITRTVKTFLNTNPVAKKYTPWIKPDNKGLFRLLTIRDCPVTRQLMISLQINPVSFTPEHDDLTKANPTMENFAALPDEEKVALRKEHIKKRQEREMINVQSEAMEEFSIAFRDFCIENFYGGSIWRQPADTTSFIPPHDSYDLETESSGDLNMAKDPSYETNNQYVSKKTYKPLPDDTKTDSISQKGRDFTTKYNYSLASVIVQSHSGVANSAEMNALQECVFGSHYIYAQLCDLFFRVSINSFLQVNIKAATSLYNIARHWAMAPKHDFAMTTEDAEMKYLGEFQEMEQRYQQHLWNKDIYKTAITPIQDSEYDPALLIVTPPAIDLPEDQKPTVLFDVCCGTGTIGLINSSSAKEVVGIDIVQSAIDDANANAKLNKIEKAEFLCGKAEDVMESVLKRFPAEAQSTSVAILDPPRNGLHTKVLSALRESSLQRIVYISCNQKTLAEDVLRLAGPPSKSYPNAPFIPIAALGVDLFPHTQHCEAVMLLERRPVGEGKHVKEFKSGEI